MEKKPVVTRGGGRQHEGGGAGLQTETLGTKRAEGQPVQPRERGSVF